MINRRRIVFSAAVLALLLAAVYFVYMEEQGNFHAITSGEAYRSAQLDRDELEYYIKKYNIKSIINLRGEHPDEAWYLEEKQVSSENNINLYSLPFSSSKEPDEKLMSNLIDIFKKASRPVLIHCQAGADRSGLAAAIWKVVIDKEPKMTAENQLSIFYGHLPIGKTTVIDGFFNKWTPVLR